MLFYNTERNFKFSKGDKVVVLIYDEKYVGLVEHISYDRVNTPNSMYYVRFKPDKYGKYQCSYYFSENELSHIEKKEDRDWKLRVLLEKKES